MRTSKSLSTVTIVALLTLAGPPLQAQTAISFTDPSGYQSLSCADIFCTTNAGNIASSNPAAKLGLGLPSGMEPVFKLHLADDAGIFSESISGRGTTLPVLKTYPGGDQFYYSHFIWYPKKSAFRAGIFDPELPNGYILNDESIGNYSFAFGVNAKALGSGSIALGSQAQALKDSSIAIGWGAKADGSSSPSLALGVGAQAIGTSATAVGSNSSAGEYSVSVGYANKTDTARAGAFGYQNKANADTSYAIGADNTVSAGRGMVFGVKNIVSGINSIAIGHQMTISGQNALGINMNPAVPVKMTQNSIMSIMGGKVGINTVEPTTELQVTGTTATDVLLVSGAGPQDEAKLVVSGHTKISGQYKLIMNTPTKGKAYCGPNDSFQWVCKPTKW